MTNPIANTVTIVDVVDALRNISDVVSVDFHPTDPSANVVIDELSRFYVLVCIDPLNGSIFDEADVCDFKDPDRNAPPTYYDNLDHMIDTLNNA